MRKYILLIGLLATLNSSAVEPKLNGETQCKAFFPDGNPFVVADSAFMPDMKGNHRVLV